MKLMPYERRLMYRFQLSYEQGDICAYCTQPMGEKATLDHVVPKCWGGRSGARYNLIAVCDNCNRHKGAHESRIHVDFPELTTIERCARLSMYLRREKDKKAVNFGYRSVLFDRIPAMIHMAVAQHLLHGDFDAQDTPNIIHARRQEAHASAGTQAIAGVREACTHCNGTGYNHPSPDHRVGAGLGPAGGRDQVLLYP